MTPVLRTSIGALIAIAAISYGLSPSRTGGAEAPKSRTAASTQIIEPGWRQTNGDAGRSRYSPTPIHSPSLIAEVDAAGSWLLSDDRLLFIDAHPQMVAVELATGRKVWTSRRPAAAIAGVTGGKLLGGQGGSLIGIKTSDGTQAVVSYGEGPDPDDMFIPQPGVAAMPRLVRTVKKGDNVENVFYVERDVSTGRALAVRRLPIPPEDEAYGYANGQMGAFGSGNSLLFGFNYQNPFGDAVTLWDRRTCKRLGYRHFPDRVNVVAGRDSNLYVLLRNGILELGVHGETRWKRPLKPYPREKDEEPPLGTMAVTPKHVVLGWGNSVICISRETGKDLWKFEPRAPEVLGPSPQTVICGERVYVCAGAAPLGDPRQSLIGLELPNGKLDSTLRLPFQNIGSLGASGRYLFATAGLKTIILAGEP